jgi:AcrR family transcriptional regulator
VARTVDPHRYAARRRRIMDAGFTRFAAVGFDRATTSSVCREAGIGSGTFFHYFPTKLSLLLAILESGTSETEEWFAAQTGRPDALAVIEAYAAFVAEQLTEPRLGGFVRATGSVMSDPEVAVALAADARVVEAGLLTWVVRGQADGQIRTDLRPERVCGWIVVLLDGLLSNLATDEVDPPDVVPADVIDAVRRLVSP